MHLNLFMFLRVYINNTVYERDKIMKFKQYPSLLMFFLIAALMTMSSGLVAKNTTYDSFSGVDQVIIKTSSSDLNLQPSTTGDIEVSVESSYNPNKDPMKMVQEGSILYLKERSNGYSSSTGSSNWTVGIPNDLMITVSYSSASGSVIANDVSAKLKLNTASGDIDLNNVNGDVEGNTASGDLNTMNTVGSLTLNSASGNVIINSASLNNKSVFNTASGDVEVSLNQSPMYDLELNSASGDVELNMQGNTLQGFITMSTKNDQRFQINAPFDFDTTQIISRHGDEYIEKSVTIGDPQSKITLSTSTGNSSIND